MNRSKNSTRIALHTFLQKQPAKEREALYHYLNPVERQILEKLPKTYGDPLTEQSTAASLLKRIHPSWIAPFLRNLSQKEIGLFLAALDPSQAVLVGKELLFTNSFPTLSPLGKRFFQETLLHYLTAEIEDLLPVAFLPTSSLNFLLEITDDELAHSLDFLGLHDLSIELRQIIEKHQLTKIYEALSPAEMSYLKILLQSQEPVAFTKMGLANWNGDQEKLKLLIRQRGANRLAKALFVQDPSLVWYVLHKLDVEKALTVKKLFASLDNNRAAQILISQIVELFKFTRKEHE